MRNKEHIRPELRTFDLTMVVIGLVIGMGIFRTPAEVAIKSNSEVIFFSAWILGAIISFFGAMTFAEIGSRFHAAGGFYQLFSHCYHPALAFMVNWITVISNAASTAGVAIMGSEYLAPVILPNMQKELATKLISISSLLVLFAVNMFGMKLSSKVLNVLMIIKLSLLALIIVALFNLPETESIHLTYTNTEPWWKTLALCFIPVFFTYGGYQQTMNFGGDIKNASQTFPRAIFFGMIIVLCMYLLANYSYVHCLGFYGLQSSTTIAADICRMMFGNAAFYIVSIIMFISVMAYINVSIMSNPRVYYAMAQDGVLPKLLLKINPKTQVQEWALTFFCCFIFVTLFFLSSFQHILHYVMFFDSISLIIAAAAIFILRKKSKQSNNNFTGFKVPAYPFLPLIYIIVYAAVNVSVFLTDSRAFYIGFLLFILGWPLYHVLKKLLN